MPSYLHEALLMLFRNRPALAPELLRDALHVELPDYELQGVSDFRTLAERIQSRL